MSIIINININKAITFTHLICGIGNKIDWCPCCITHEVNAIIMDCMPHLHDMGLEIINTIIIMNAQIRFFNNRDICFQDRCCCCAHSYEISWD